MSKGERGAGGVRAPVFVVGAPRSGTTMLRVILNRHREIAMIADESAFMGRLYNRRKAFGDPGEAGNRGRIAGAYLETKAAGRLGMDLEALRARLLKEGVSWRALFEAMLRERAEAEGKPYGGEKTPAHALHVETLCEWFPGCGVIHIVRDPRDSVSSNVRMPWATRSVLLGARTWRLFNAGARRVAARGNYVRVRYEDLISEPERQLRRLCGHIGVEYDGGMREPRGGEFDARPRVARAYGEITPARVGLWRGAFEPWQIRVIEETAGAFLEECGYERLGGGRATAWEWARGWGEALLERSIQGVLRMPSTWYGTMAPTELAAEERWMERATRLYGRWRTERAAEMGPGGGRAGSGGS